MEEARLRRFDFTLLQDQQAGSDRAPLETLLRFHFHSHPRGLGHKNLPARPDVHGQCARFLSSVARRSHPLVAGRLCLCGHLHQRDWDYHLRQQESFRRNFRICHTSFALENLKKLMVEKSAMAESLSDVSSAGLNTQPSTFNKLCEIVAKLRG